MVVASRQITLPEYGIDTLVHVIRETNAWGDTVVLYISEDSYYRQGFDLGMSDEDLAEQAEYLIEEHIGDLISSQEYR